MMAGRGAAMIDAVALADLNPTSRELIEIVLRRGSLSPGGNLQTDRAELGVTHPPYRAPGGRGLPHRR